MKSESDDIKVERSRHFTLAQRLLCSFSIRRSCHYLCTDNDVRWELTMDYEPFQIVAASFTTYGSIFAGTRWSALRSRDSRTNLRAISSGHSFLTTLAVIYALNCRWPIRNDELKKSSELESPYLDDCTNPMIHGQSRMGNAITSWETGYLLYDTLSLLCMSHKDPIMLGHHFTLIGALSTLQVYIAKHRQRGMWIIVAFLIMNATNPILHWRWWQKKRIGRNDIRTDLLFSISFAICRFGTVAYVLSQYGKFHNIGIWEAFWRQRAVCKIGTATLLSLNAFWWVSLNLSLAKRQMKLKHN